MLLTNKATLKSHVLILLLVFAPFARSQSLATSVCPRYSLTQARSIVSAEPRCSSCFNCMGYFTGQDTKSLCLSADTAQFTECFTQLQNLYLNPNLKSHGYNDIPRCYFQCAECARQAKPLGIPTQTRTESIWETNFPNMFRKQEGGINQARCAVQPPAFDTTTRGPATKPPVTLPVTRGPPITRGPLATIAEGPPPVAPGLDGQLPITRGPVPHREARSAGEGSVGDCCLGDLTQDYNACCDTIRCSSPYVESHTDDNKEVWYPVRFRFMLSNSMFYYYQYTEHITCNSRVSNCDPAVSCHKETTERTFLMTKYAPTDDFHDFLIVIFPDRNTRFMHLPIDSYCKCVI